MPTTYAIIDACSGRTRRGLPLHDAAHALLTADGYSFAILPEIDGAGFRLWLTRRPGVATTPAEMNCSIFFSLHADQGAAETEIFQKVADHDHPWHGWEAMTDEAYERIAAELHADEQGI